MRWGTADCCRWSSIRGFRPTLGSSCITSVATTTRTSTSCASGTGARCLRLAGRCCGSTCTRAGRTTTAVRSRSAVTVDCMRASGRRPTVRRRSAPTPCSASSCGSQSTGRSAARDRGVRAPEPVAVLLRHRDRRHVHRGCRREPARGGQPPPARLPRHPNFGWNIFEGGIRHRPVPTDLVGTLLPPFVEYPTRKGRCDSVVGGYVYRGRRVPALRGRYVYGDLCGGAWSVRVAGGRASGHRTEPLSPGAEPLVSFGRTASGELLVVGFGGSLYRIE